MSFEQASDALVQYRDRHCRSLRNKERMSWATETLADTDFSSAATAGQYHDEYVKTNFKATAQKLIRLGSQVSWLASAGRDIRAQFVSCWNGDPKGATYRSGTESFRLAFEMGNYFMNRLKGIAKVLVNK